MKIRTWLLTALLPALLVYIILISSFFYYNWYKEITGSFEDSLEATVVSVAESINKQDVTWLSQHRHDRSILDSEIYQRLAENLRTIRDDLGLSDLYIIQYAHPSGENKTEKPSHVYLIDAGNTPIEEEEEPKAFNRPSDYRKMQPFEQRVYETKRPVITPTYQLDNSKQRLISGFAPIFDSNQAILALVGADISLKVVENDIGKAFILILMGFLATMACVILTVVIAANKISKPVEVLKDAALGIAAGEYGEKVAVKGPREIVELANTLSTMSECMKENITRLRENSTARERLYGEYECCLLMQHHMFQKVIDNFHDKALALSALKIRSTVTTNGVLLKIDQKQDQTRFILSETENKGIVGLMELIKDTHATCPAFPRLEVTLSKHNSQLTISSSDMPQPIIWSIEQKKLLHSAYPTQELTGNTMIIMYNRGLAQLFGEKIDATQWFSKVLKHFAAESLDLFITMLNNELHFFTLKEQVNRNIRILCIHVNQKGFSEKAI